MEVNNTRIYRLREYLLRVIDGIRKDNKATINANMLANNAESYSLDKVPSGTQVSQWVTGQRICQDTYSFRNRTQYSIETMQNLQNVGFFEIFEKTINSNNRNGVFPEIEGIQAIKCLTPRNDGKCNNKHSRV